MTGKPRIAVLASGEGHTLQALIDACASGALDAQIAMLVTNRAQAGAAERARQASIAIAHLSSATHPEPDALDAAIETVLDDAGIDYVVLAGYLKRLGARTLRRFSGRMINTHPALLPLHGGPGMYGRRVHEAVLACGASLTGATIHYVTASYDTGPVIAQREVAIRGSDTAETLEARVKSVEQALLIDTLAELTAAGVADLSRLSCPVGYAVQPAAPRHLAAQRAIELAAAGIFSVQRLPAPWRNQTTPVAELQEACAAHRLWVALTTADEPVGFALTDQVAGIPHLKQMDVHPAHGRRGLGAALVRHVLEHARCHHAPAVTLTTFADVAWNAPFYARCGFQTLDECAANGPAAVSPQLRAILTAERDGGLRERVAMRADLR